MVIDFCRCGHTEAWHSRDRRECQFHCGNPEQCQCTGFQPSGVWTTTNHWQDHPAIKVIADRRSYNGDYVGYAAARLLVMELRQAGYDVVPTAPDGLPIVI
jgi:hypothetical protein